MKGMLYFINNLKLKNSLTNLNNLDRVALVSHSLVGFASHKKHFHSSNDSLKKYFNNKRIYSMSLYNYLDIGLDERRYKFVKSMISSKHLKSNTNYLGIIIFPFEFYTNFKLSGFAFKYYGKDSDIEYLYITIDNYISTARINYEILENPGTIIFAYRAIDVDINAAGFRPMATRDRINPFNNVNRLVGKYIPLTLNEKLFGDKVYPIMEGNRVLNFISNKLTDYKYIWVGFGDRVVEKCTYTKREPFKFSISDTYYYYNKKNILIVIRNDFYIPNKDIIYIFDESGLLLTTLEDKINGINYFTRTMGHYSIDVENFEITGYRFGEEKALTTTAIWEAPFFK